MKTFACLIAGASAVKLNAHVSAAVRDFLASDNVDYYDFEDITNLQIELGEKWEETLTANDRYLDQISDEVDAIKDIADTISGDDNTHWDDFKNELEQRIDEMEPDLRIAFAKDNEDIYIPEVLETESNWEPAAL